MTTQSKIVPFRRFKVGEEVQISRQIGDVSEYRRGIAKTVKGDRVMVQVGFHNLWRNVSDVRRAENWLGRTA